MTMRPCNLLLHSIGANAIYQKGNGNIKKITQLKDHEIIVLKQLCDVLVKEGCAIQGFEGYYIGYTIDQISKEFDLLRFGYDNILNIEFKSELTGTKSENEKKIYKQLKINHYYLKMVSSSIDLIMYVENDGFYQFSADTDSIRRILAKDAVEIMMNHRWDETIDPCNVFIPSNYLISPFNTTEKFINGEYFLTQHQLEIKKDIIAGGNQFEFYCITANAGTGKTLLIYDIAKTMISKGTGVLVIHCANLNDGQRLLISKYKWHVISAKNIHYLTSQHMANYGFIIVDEAQRIYDNQLDMLITMAKQQGIPVAFSYDVKQYLMPSEKKDVYEYITANHPNCPVKKYSLTNKIRTNKAIASFIKNMFSIGSSSDNQEYDNITVEFSDSIDYLEEYSRELVKNGWQPIKYTTSYYHTESFDIFATLSSLNPHKVIGQEYSKVVLYLNENFRYINNRLVARDGYYDALGMAYQIATRVVNELKIVVLNNVDLYEKLCSIKHGII